MQTYDLIVIGSGPAGQRAAIQGDRKSTRLNSSHSQISYAVFCLKKKKKKYTVGESIDRRRERQYRPIFETVPYLLTLRYHCRFPHSVKPQLAHSLSNK